jgi:cellulose synthase (UDP-forming)
VQKIAAYYGAIYISREEKVHRKAGNLNCGLEHSKGEFILVLDADQVATPTIAEDLLGYFMADKNIAIVSTRQHFDVPRNDFNHDTIFYQHMQAGKNADNSAISCGSGVFYRRSALKAIGGFQTWNIVEDLYTSYVLHCEGYVSIYINRPYTFGTAPMDIPMIYKQRGTWALDTMRLFFKKSPFFKKKLSFRQKIHYFEMAWFYIVPAIAVSILFLLPAVALFFDVRMLTSELSYLFFRIALLILVFFFFFRLNGYSLSSTQYWAALSFVFLQALVKAIFTNDMRYKVTDKSDKEVTTEIRRVLPHLSYVSVNIWALVWYIAHQGHTASLTFIVMNSVWIFFMCICFFPILRRGLFPHGLRFRAKKVRALSLEEPLDLLKYRNLSNI